MNQCINENIMKIENCELELNLWTQRTQQINIFLLS